MKYEVLVSHGLFAQGLGNALSMLAGERDDVIAVGLENGKSAEQFAQIFADAISKITADDEIILLGDIIGGSPLTTAMTEITGKGFIDRQTLTAQVLSEPDESLKEFKVASEETDDEI